METSVDLNDKQNESTLQDYHRSPMEFGNVDSLVTGRCYHKGIDSKHSIPRKIHGMIYIFRSERGRAYAVTADY